MASILSREEYSGFPSEFVSPKIKESKEYGLKYFRAVYNKYYMQGGYYSQVNNLYIENRKYAEGLQSVDKYKDLIDNEGDLSHLNLDWSIVPIVPKYVDLLLGEMTNMDHSISFSAIDPASQAKKEEKRNRYLANMELKAISDAIAEETGVEMIDETQYVPDSAEELDLHMNMNFKQSTEIAMEEVVAFVLKSNKFKNIKRKLYRDLIVNKRAAGRLYRDHNGDIKIRYVDIVNLVVPFTDKDDFSDVKYAGEIIRVELHQLRRMSKGELSEEQLFDIAKHNSGKFGNRNWSYGNSYSTYYNNYGVAGSSGITEYDDFAIPVLDLEFHSINVTTFEEKSNNYGGFYFQEKPYGYQPPANSKQKRKITEKEIDVVYQGKWVIGTDYLIDYGLKENMTRKKENGAYSPETELSFIIFSPDIYDMENKSMVERMRPHADAIQIIALKMQHLITKLTPPGLAIDVSALNDVLTGKGQASAGPLDIQDLYQQTGVFYYNGTNLDGTPMNRRPIEELKNSIGPVLQELALLYDYHKQQIRDVTGINEVREASSIDKDAPVATQQMSMSASRNATRSIVDAFVNIFERIAEQTSLMVQDMADRKGEIERFESAIGKESVQVLKDGKELSMAQFGITIEAAPDQEEKMNLERNLQIALQNGDIRLEDYIAVKSIKLIKTANQYLILKKKQYSEQKMQEAREASEQNAMIQERAAMAKAQADSQSAQIKAQAEEQNLRLKYRLEDENSKAEHEREVEKINLENEWKSRHIKMASEEEFKSTDLNKQVPQERVFSKEGQAPPSVSPMS